MDYRGEGKEKLEVLQCSREALISILLERYGENDGQTSVGIVPRYF